MLLIFILLPAPPSAICRGRWLVAWFPLANSLSEKGSEWSPKRLPFLCWRRQHSYCGYIFTDDLSIHRPIHPVMLPWRLCPQQLHHLLVLTLLQSQGLQRWPCGALELPPPRCSSALPDGHRNMWWVKKHGRNPFRPMHCLHPNNEILEWNTE